MVPLCFTYDGLWSCPDIVQFNYHSLHFPFHSCLWGLILLLAPFDSLLLLHYLLYYIRKARFSLAACTAVLTKCVSVYCDLCESVLMSERLPLACQTCVQLTSRYHVQWEGRCCQGHFDKCVICTTCTLPLVHAVVPSRACAVLSSPAFYPS